MDLRELNELGFAIFGQLLDKKADFRILKLEGILKDLPSAFLEKLFQLPYGFEIDENKEFLSFIKFTAQKGKLGRDEKYILISKYKFAGIDKNKRKNYYAACIAFKYNKLVVKSEAATRYLNILLETSKAKIVKNDELPVMLQSLEGIEKVISFERADISNQLAFHSSKVGEEIDAKFIDFNYSNSDTIKLVGRNLLALGCEKLTGVNSLEIKTIDVDFNGFSEKSDLSLLGKLTFKESKTAGEAKVMIENKDDYKVESAISAKIAPLEERLQKLESVKQKEITQVSSNLIGNILLGAICLLLAAVVLLLIQSSNLNFSYKKISQSETELSNIKKQNEALTLKIDSLISETNKKGLLYILKKRESIQDVIKLFNVEQKDIYPKNWSAKVGDTLVIKTMLNRRGNLNFEPF